MEGRTHAHCREFSKLCSIPGALTWCLETGLKALHLEMFLSNNFCLESYFKATHFFLSVFSPQILLSSF